MQLPLNSFPWHRVTFGPASQPAGPATSPPAKAHLGPDPQLPLRPWRTRVAPAAAFPSASVHATADPAPCPIRRGGHAPRALAPAPAVAHPTRRRLHQPSHALPASAPPSPVRRGRRLPKKLNPAMKFVTPSWTSATPFRSQPSSGAPHVPGGRAAGRQHRRPPLLKIRRLPSFSARGEHTPATVSISSSFFLTYPSTWQPRTPAPPPPSAPLFARGQRKGMTPTILHLTPCCFLLS
jgi:hypothetical protein